MASDTSIEAPHCKTCFKQLPLNFQGFDICPMCVYQARVKKAQMPSCRPPSYESPLLALEREIDAY